MKRSTQLKYAALTGVFVAGALLAGCKHDRGPASFEIEVINLTAHQPLSPPGVVLHGDGFAAWKLGDAASVPLEHLAEGGSPAMLVASASAHEAVRKTHAAEMPIGPGHRDRYVIDVDEMQDIKLTIATMLVNTNDAFTGVTGHDIGAMAVHDRQHFYVRAYDAGTELNTELAGTIPGPAGGGEGFNAEREMHDQVRVHNGVLTQADGLADSALDESHRFDNPVAQIIVHRMR